MDDGTSKPIEQIRPGDMVLAVDHNDPEHDTPKPAKVTRFFDNGLKNVVKLIFENQETKEQFEVICTPSHRFYVKNKGWMSAESLLSGEQCISAEECKITFISREEHEQQNVYNFEVEEEHTYFVDIMPGNSIMVHNACPLCNDTKYITVTNKYSGLVYSLIQGAAKGMSPVTETYSKVIPCYCQSYIYYPNSEITPWQLYQEWLTGLGPLERRFTGDDFMLVELKNSKHIRETREHIIECLQKQAPEYGNTSVSFPRYFYSSLSGLYNGYIDILESLIVGKEKVSTSQFLGSYECKIDINIHELGTYTFGGGYYGTADLCFTVKNITSNQSYHRNILGKSSVENYLKGPKKNISQIFI